MPKRRVILWCGALKKFVHVTLVQVGEEFPTVPPAPEGWGVKRCLDEGIECMGKECPFARVPEGSALEKLQGAFSLLARSKGLIRIIRPRSS